MKKFFVATSFLLVLLLNLTAQQNHFIYIQADNKQPFYVKLNNKIYSSSTSGYIILSKLLEADYNLIVGFPKKEWPDQKLNLTVQKNDLGYLLKNFDEKGWGLVDMHTFQILYASGQSNITNPNVKKNDAKTKPTEINKEEPKNQQNDVVKAIEPPKDIIKEQPKPSETNTPEKSIVKAEKLKGKPKEIIKEETKPIEKTEPEVKQLITKLFTSTSNTGIEMVYVVKSPTSTDTVRITTPISNNQTQTNQAPQPVKTIDVVNNNNETVQASSQPISKPKETPIEIKPKSEPPKQEVSNNTTTQTNENTNVQKNNCKAVATEDDYKKLRKKMASAESDNEMLFRAYTSFQKQCYTTEQIKTLSFLFLNDDGKYKFFDTAYPFVTDVENFPKLATVITDEYYVKRFKAMLKN